MFKRKKQTERILDYMRKNPKGITSYDAFNLGITRLSGRIFELRNAGYDIETEYVTGLSSRYGRYILRGEPNGR